MMQSEHRESLNGKGERCRIMKATLSFLALTVFSLGALSQTVPTPIIPERIDPIRFREFDVNHDGKLDLEKQEAERASRPAWEAEKRARAAAFRQKMEADKRQFDLQRFDANHDGVLDATEQQAQDQWYAAQQKEFLKKYDKNGNGKIDPEEIRQIVPVKSDAVNLNKKATP